MARKAILDTYYTFTPSTRTIVIPRAVPRERLVLITNVTTNQVLFNFSDATLKATSYTISTDASGAYTSTTIVLNFNTTALSATDKLQILVDEYDEKFTPSETYLDAVNKLRVSQPQSLIDTDYEYSTQATKWENLAVINNRPFAYFNFDKAITYTDISATNGSRTYVISTTAAGTNGLYVGQPISVLDTLFAGADGVYVIDSIVAGTSISYTGKFYFTGTTGSINYANSTAIYGAYVFTGATIPLSSMSYVSNLVTVTTSVPHGLVVGNEVAVAGTTATTNAPNGSWTVASLLSPTSYTFYATNTPTGSVVVTPSAPTVQTMTGKYAVGVQSNTAAAPGQLITGTGIAPNTYVGFMNTATITSSVSTTTLTVTAQSGQLILPPMNLTGGAFSPSTAYVNFQLTSTASAAATIAFQTSSVITGASGTSVIPLANTTSVAVGQLVTGTGTVNTLGCYVGAILISSGTGYSGVSLVNYLGAPVTLNAQASGNYNFYAAGGLGTYNLSASSSGSPTAATSATLTVPATATGSVTATLAATNFVKPSGNILHRSYDGGVRFSTNASSHNHAFYRQTRRYFRYQSGKAIQMSTGTTLKPQMSLDSLTASGTTITLKTKDPHNINSGVLISVSGANEPQYNTASSAIVSVITPYQFTYTAASAPAVAAATGTPIASVVGWYGNANRVGIYDTMNGMYFEYDGAMLFAVVRSSTFQLFGTIAINAGSNTVTGTGTTFSKQLTPGDFVVIKGMSYRVLTIDSDTQITISPGYRSTTNLAAGNQIMKTFERRIPQYAFNVDRLDGTGPSGMNVDLSRMQMFYIDYSWYGTGFIRFGIRGADGNVIYIHRFINNNSQYLAYMRSGNLPGRYESHTYPKIAIAIPNTGIVGAGSIVSTDNSIYLSNTYLWPSAGSALIRNASANEYVNYAGISAVSILSFNTTAGSNILTGVSTTNVVVGQYVSGPNIPYGVQVQAVATNVSVTISQPAFVTSVPGAPITLLFNPALTGVTRAQAGGSITATTTTGSTLLSSMSTTSGVQIGQYVYGTGIPNQAYVVSFVANTSVTISQAATAANTTTITFAPMGGSAQSFTLTSTALASVELHSPQFASEINHWGTSAIMDGQFTNDKQFIFTKGMTTQLQVAPSINNAIMSLRISPSASNGIAAQAIGLRDVITRMQLILVQADVLTNGNYLMTLVLNGTTLDPTAAGSLTWQAVGGSSLSQYIIHNVNTAISGGETIFGFYLNTGAGGTSYQSTQQDLSLVRDLGTSILGGGLSVPTTGIYPDGPDVVTICAQNLGFTTTNIQARLSWTEAQA